MSLNPKIVEALLNWYDYNARILPWREEPTPYRVWISEIMLQQTRVEAVKPFYERFMRELPDVEALASVDDDKLMKLWEGLGYYNRARNLKIAANQIMNEFEGQMPADYEKLLSLKGIGEYTAGAIGSIAFRLPVAAVDGNVLRVITRITGDERDILKQSTKRAITADLLEIIPRERAGDFNQALMELGATVCVPNGQPKCEMCPWDTVCKTYKEDLIAKIPVKTPKKKRRIEQKTVFLLEYQNKIAIRKREEKGLLAGLWEFPNEERSFSIEDLEQQLKKWEVAHYHFEATAKHKHIFSHIEWHMTGFYVECQEKPSDDFIWISREELEESYAVPSAFEAFKAAL
ncbi:MAG: A/G-specific adenine glycosylase [Lachnospiraceae bacterium]|nr:A/G-specific adenine glycosylase [Lachnospiraceae bacterium]